jgi:hypothetical protein
MTQQATLVTEVGPAPEVNGESARSERWSAAVFGVALAVALPLILWFGRDHWFFLDDWWVLTRDGLTSPGYFDGHNGHWITLLRLDYRLNFELWGLHSYLPYQVPVVLAHLAAAVLVRQVTRRLGVRGWIATTAALAFLFFGSGRENMVYGFQLSLTGSVVCGLALLLLAEGPRSVTRRDWLALGVGVAGLMTSGVFPALLVGFGVTTLLRRGVRVTAFYAVPLGAIYLAWHTRYGQEDAAALELTREAVRFFGRMFWATFDGLAQGGVGALLIVIAGLGLAAAIRSAPRPHAWVGAALPISLAASWLAFASLTALSRANNPITAQSHDSGRYLYVGAALLLPLVAAGAEHLARYHALVGVAALVPLAIGVPGNLDRLSHTEPIYKGGREIVLAMAHSPFVEEVPPDTLTVRGGVFDVPLTTGWLARKAATGRIPKPDRADPTRDLTATTWLVFEQEAGPPTPSSCPPLSRARALTLRAGDAVRFTGTINIAATDGDHGSQPRGFDSRNGTAIRVQAGPVDALLRPAMGLPARVCVPQAG